MTALILALALAPSPHSVTYPAALVGCYDGDTCRFDLQLEQREADLGLGVWQRTETWMRGQAVRLASIDAPEMHDDRLAAVRSRDALIGWIRAAKSVQLEIVRREKYGRWLAWVIADDENLNLRLQEEGLARPYGGEG